MRLARALTLLAGLLAAPPAFACGPASDCMLGERSYRIAMPEGADGPVGAILHVHGYKGSADGVMRNRALRGMARDLGVALIAANAVEGRWSLPNAPGGRGAGYADELAYFDALVADAAARFPIDPHRIMVSGFSAGGMVVWNLACDRPEAFAAYAPVAGTFWAPLPESCEGPAPPMVHVHGTSDEVVPLQGRPIGDTRQGEVEGAIALFERVHGFRVDGVAREGDLICDRWRNAESTDFWLCLHEGGHRLDPAWLAHAWRTMLRGRG